MEKVYGYEGKTLTFERNENGFNALLRAMEENRTVEGICYLCDPDKNLHIHIGKLHGIMPRGECLYCPSAELDKDIAVVTRVGKPICFKIKGMERGEEGEPLFYLSRRDAQAECMREYISRLTPGDVIEAKITRLDPFGAFCDIGCGITALLPIDRMSVSRISHPKDRFRQGQIIKAVVRGCFDEYGRITLSHRELLGTWEENASLFEPGQTAAGIIRSVEDYGVFVELAPNLAGLSECFEGAEVGQTAAVYIKNIIPSRMKIKLAMIDCYSGKATANDYDYPDIDHIDSWRYSPKGCDKIIETVFNT